MIETTPSDRYFDYCLQPYEPAAPAQGKWRSESLLWHALEVAGLRGGRVETSLRRVQAHAGRDLTVWGVKHDRGRLFLELYFYDPRKEDPRVAASSVIAALEGTLRFAPSVRESIPYFMWSFDLDAETERSGRVDALHLYLAAREIQAGRSYTLRGGGAIELVNHYRFLHPQREIDELLHGIESSVFVDFERVPLSRVLLPQLFACNRICVAKKRAADGIYYSGLSIDQLRFFLERFGWPGAIRSLVERERARLDHLRYDVGIDYRMLEDGSLESTKTSFYGTL
ncbi:MAG: hypothetical protein IT378_27100 [Sandaracinaceae bacterium]|nr:hypothetical protein [Sandaracinaceae bacterium]